MAVAIVLVLLVVGSILFHFLSPWYFTPIASNWGMIDDTVTITFWVTGFVFVAINCFMAYAVVRYRYQKGRRAAYEPENKKLEWWLTGLTTLGVVAMLAPGLFVWAKFVEVPKEASVIEAIGQQWHWSFRFPGKDGVLGTVDSKYVSVENAFGINTDDPSGQDDVLIASNEVHLPIDKPVKVLLRSKDVLHNFAVPQFRVKMDLVPGMVPYIWFTPTRTGKFEILCEELCGIGHFAMRGSVVVEEQTAFQTWLSSHPTFAQSSSRAAGDAVAGEPLYAACAACHGPQGEGNLALNAPKLSGLEDWYMKRQLKYFKQGARGTHDQDVFGKMMAPMAATLVDDVAMENVVAYIKTLPDNPAPATVNGDAAKGKRFMRPVGPVTVLMGRADGPQMPPDGGYERLVYGYSIENFKQGIRGAHPQDMYGPQMGLMADILVDDQAINDLVAYINTL